MATSHAGFVVRAAGQAVCLHGARGTSEKPVNKRVVQCLTIAAPQAVNTFDEAGWAYHRPAIT